MSAMSDAPASDQLLKRTPLYALHVARAPRWCHSPATRCPCSIRSGILKEHLHTREKAGLFDVSHMGQAFLVGRTTLTLSRPRWKRWCRPIS